MGTSKRQTKSKSDDTQPLSRRLAVWIGAGILVLGTAGWAGVGCMNKNGEVSRSVSADEATRLANMRMKDLDLGTVAILARMPEDLGATEVSGWVDWTQPLVYAALKPKDQPAYTGLMQAVPGLVATRPGDVAADPKDMPADGWSVRRTTGADAAKSTDPLGQALDIVMSAVMVLSSNGPDDVRAYQERAVWLNEASIDGAVVDVFRAPIVVGPAPGPDATGTASAPPASSPEAVLSLDRSGQLRRAQVNLSGHGVATIDFLVGQRPDPEHARIPAIDLLGGAPVAPRKVTDAEAKTLADLRRHNAGTVSALDLTMPVGDGELLRAKGWIDWRQPLAYLTVDNPGTERDGQMFVLPSGVGWRAAPVGEGGPKAPPLPAAADGWQAQPWSARVGADGNAGDMDLLLFKLLTMATRQADNPATIKDTASWLREGHLGKQETTTYEFPMSGDQTAPSGQAPFRYWIGEKETLLRVEMRTRLYGLAQANLSPVKQLAWINPPGPVASGLK